MELINNFCIERGLTPPLVGIEPGRSIVGDAGVTLYTVGTVKQIPGGTHYVSIDGGMSDNIRPALYGDEYEAVIANKAGEIPSEKVTVCGKLCETGGRIIEDVFLASPKRGDTLCVFATGAYGYSMASNYNKLPKPAVVLVKDGEAKLIVRRQTLESMTGDEL
jgi:diaminopimelate decarboxylase